MASTKERFADIACELTGEDSPSDIRRQEFDALVAEQQEKKNKDWVKMYETIFDDSAYFRHEDEW